MRQLHIRAQSGPRPVTAAAVRAMLADGSVDATSPVLSLDAGRTWQPVETALAVIDGLAVDDHAVDHALRVGPLHPIAMPLGAVGLVLLAAGIGLGGGPEAQVVREAPLLAGVAVVTTVGSGIGAVQSGLASGVACVGSLASGFMLAGSGAGPVQAAAQMPASPETAANPGTAPAKPAPASGDLLADWRTLANDRERGKADWAAAAEVLAKRTKAAGIEHWAARLTMLEPLSDDNRARFTASFPGADKAIRMAMLDVDAGKDVERIDLLLLIEDKPLAAACDKLAAADHEIHVSGTISVVTPDADKRTVVLQGVLSAAE